MVIPLLRRLEDDARLLEKVCPHVGAHDVMKAVEFDLDVFPEATAVVIPCRLGIADRLEEGGHEMIYVERYKRHFVSIPFTLKNPQKN